MLLLGHCLLDLMMVDLWWLVLLLLVRVEALLVHGGRVWVRVVWVEMGLVVSLGWVLRMVVVLWRRAHLASLLLGVQCSRGYLLLGWPIVAGQSGRHERVEVGLVWRLEPGGHVRLWVDWLLVLALGGLLLRWAGNENRSHRGHVLRFLLVIESGSRLESADFSRRNDRKSVPNWTTYLSEQLRLSEGLVFGLRLWGLTGLGGNQVVSVEGCRAFYVRAGLARHC